MGRINSDNDPCIVNVMKGREVVSYVPHIKDSRTCAAFSTGGLLLTRNHCYSHDLPHKYSLNVIIIRYTIDGKTLAILLEAAKV